MSEKSNLFLKEMEKLAWDQEMHSRINTSLNNWQSAFESGKERINHLSQVRQKAFSIKYKVLNQLDKYLVEFETNFQRNGGKVIWARNAEDAINEIITILTKEKLTKVIKSRSLVSEEIDLIQHLTKRKIEVLSTDTGEFITKIAGEKPFHPVAAALHKSRQEIVELISSQFDLHSVSSLDESVRFVVDHMKEFFAAAQVSISGANFLIADSGSIAITENEGNILLGTALPKIQIILAGIEKIIPNMEDLDLFWPLLSTFASGQTMATYNTILSGPALVEHEETQMIVILLDNGRTDLLSKMNQRMSLACINCGACHNVSPVFRLIGGPAYNATYTGPIGAIKMPHLNGMKEYQHLSFASSLNGASTQICPMAIPIHEMLLFNRKEAVTKKLIPASDRKLIKRSTHMFKKRSRMNIDKTKIKKRLFNYFISKNWGNKRELPKIAIKSFGQLWKENKSDQN